MPAPLLLLALSLPHHDTPGPGSDHDAGPAIRFYEERVEAQPADLTAWSKLGPLYLGQGRRTGAHEDFRSARAAFEQVLELSPASSGAHVGIGYAELGRHGFEAALSAAREAVRRAPDSPRALALLGDVHFALGNYVEAEALFLRLGEGGWTSDGLARVGMCHQVRGRYDEARRSYENALEAGRLLSASAHDQAWTAALLGDLELELGDGDAAEARYAEALELDPDCKLAFHGLCKVLRARGESERAVPHLRRLVDLSPEAVQWLALGEALMDVGAEAEARRWFRKAEDDMVADLRIGEHGHLRQLVEHWLAHGGDAARAAEVALLDLAQRRDVGSLSTAAWALHRAGDSEQAARLVTEALRWGGADAELLRRAAEILRAAGADAQAAALSERARERVAVFRR